MRDVVSRLMAPHLSQALGQSVFEMYRAAPGVLAAGKQCRGQRPQRADGRLVDDQHVLAAPGGPGDGPLAVVEAPGLDAQRPRRHPVGRGVVDADEEVAGVPGEACGVSVGVAAGRVEAGGDSGRRAHGVRAAGGDRKSVV